MKLLFLQISHRRHHNSRNMHNVAGGTDLRFLFKKRCHPPPQLKSCPDLAHLHRAHPFDTLCNLYLAIICQPFQVAIVLPK